MSRMDVWYASSCISWKQKVLEPREPRDVVVLTKVSTPFGPVPLCLCANESPPPAMHGKIAEEKEKREK